MTPYGIVYKDNLFALEQSCKIWQKKFGVLRTSVLLRVIALIEIPVIIVLSVLFIINDNIASGILSTLFIMALVAACYFVTSKSYIKQIARENISPYQKQAVIFEDRIEFTTPYSKASYPFSEIVYCEEFEGVITVIFDSGTIPVSIYKSGVGKGSYDEFSFMLRDKIIGSETGKAGM